MQEVGRVELERGRCRVGRDVTGPSEPLVALRAVGRHVEEVALLAPDRVAHELVDQGVRALEPAGPLHLRVDDDGLDRLRRDLAWEAGDLGVSEAVEGERRLEDVLAPGQHEGVGRVGATQRPGAQLAVLEDLRVPDDDLGAGLTLDAQAQPADEVLTEVDERLARRRGPDLDRRDRLLALDERPDLRHEPGAIELQRAHRQRLRLLRAQPSVDPLTAVEARRRAVAARAGPVGVGDDRLHCAVGKGDVELPGEPDLLPVVGHRLLEAEVAAPPPVSHRDLQA